MTINPYLFFNGNCKEAFEFYAKTLGGTIEAMLPHAGTPAESHVPPDWRDKIMHAYLKIGDAALMASDDRDLKEPPKGFYVSLHIAEPGEAERIFAALSDGGIVRMPMSETFWAQRFGMLVDRFGTPWMINCANPQ